MADRKPYDPGRLNRKVSIQVQSTSTDTIGQPLDAWTELRQAWADIRIPRGLETLRADRPISEVQASIRMRYCTDLNAGMRIVFGSTVYQIDAVLDDVAGRQWTDLVCKVVQ